MNSLLGLAFSSSSLLLVNLTGLPTLGLLDESAAFAMS
jgi:hypothetical protein